VIKSETTKGKRLPQCKQSERAEFQWVTLATEEHYEVNITVVLAGHDAFPTTHHEAQSLRGRKFLAERVGEASTHAPKISSRASEYREASVRSGPIMVFPPNIPTHAVQDSHQKSNQDHERKYDDHANDGPQQYVTHDAILTRKIEAISDRNHDKAII
jgi:hypothetical protein